MACQSAGAIVVVHHFSYCASHDVLNPQFGTEMFRFDGYRHSQPGIETARELP